jgi:hypothetical protein
MYLETDRLIIRKGVFTDENAVNFYDGNAVLKENGKLYLGGEGIFPDTGDASPIALWVAMLAVACVSLLVLKKKSYNF